MKTDANMNLINLFAARPVFHEGALHADTGLHGADGILKAGEDRVTLDRVVQALAEPWLRGQEPASNADIAATARESGVTEAVADRIAAGDYVVDTAALNDANRARLEQVNPQNPGTPTVYDLRANKVVDIQEPGWLDDVAS